MIEYILFCAIFEIATFGIGYVFHTKFMNAILNTNKKREIFQENFNSFMHYSVSTIILLSWFLTNNTHLTQYGTVNLQYIYPIVNVEYKFYL